MTEGTKWDYKAAEIPGSRLRLTLDEMGEDEWELVSIIRGYDVELILVFKRPRRKKEAADK